MIKYYIKSVTVKGFRGINNQQAALEIPFNTAGITSIFAPNGVGKSSIFDSISYCLNDELKCFRSLESENRDYKTVKNLFHSGDGEIKIELVDDSDSIHNIEFHIDDKGNKRIVSGNKDAVESIIEDIRDNHNFLDYNTFTDIINNSSENAGKTFLRLIGYEHFSIVQEKLAKLSRTQNLEGDFQVKAKRQEIESGKERIEHAKTEVFEKLKELALRNSIFNIKSIDKSCLRGVKKLVPEASSKSIMEISFNELMKEVNSKSSEFQKLTENLITNRQELNTLKGFKKKFRLLPQKKINAIKNKLNQAYSLIPDNRVIYLGELYEKSLNVYHDLDDIDPNTCVLCDATDLQRGRKTFADSIENKIKIYKRFKQSYYIFAKSFRTLIESSGLLQIEEFLLSESLISEKPISGFYNDQQITSIKNYDLLNLKSHINIYKAQIETKISTIEGAIEKLKQSIPEELHITITKLTLFKDVQILLEEIYENTELIKENKNYVDKAERWLQFIVSVRDKFVASTNTLLKEIASDISIDTQEFFQEIMISPEIVPRIEKKDTGQKIVMLLEKFYSAEDIKAAPLLSESNRNALCLSVFFACALRKTSKSGFIVLDDITSSFDGGHQRNLLLLLKNKISRISNRKGKQLIILTHDGELEKSLKAFSTETNKWDHYTLRSESNIKIDIKDIALTDILTELKRKSGLGENVGNEIRQYFEKIILEIHIQVNIPMLYNLANQRDDRTLHNMITNIRNVLKLYRGNRRRNVLRSLPTDNDFVDISATEKEVVNILSHFESLSSSSYTPTYILGVISKIEHFNSKFQYNCTCAVNNGATYYGGIT
ncbi:MAG: AAA family ATPase, partial [Nitrosopumilus sp.]